LRVVLVCLRMPKPQKQRFWGFCFFGSARTGVLFARHSPDECIGAVFVCEVLIGK
jgi:hypothetical protein